MKKYEGLIILSHPVDEQSLDDKLARLRAEIVKLGGAVDKMTRLGRQSFARRLNKRDSGFYVLITFLVDPLNVPVLRERLNQSEDVFRAQITAAPRREPAAEEAVQAPDRSTTASG